MTGPVLGVTRVDERTGGRVVGRAALSSEAVITEFRAKNYGCLLNVYAGGLTRLHAFIGPNDSGKSTLLRGVRSAVRIATRPSGHGIEDPLLALGTSTKPVAVTFTAAHISFECKVGDRLEEQLSGPDHPGHRVYTDAQSEGMLRGASKQAPFSSAWAQTQGVRLVRFDAEALREPSELLTEKELVRFADERGKGLAGVYDAIRNRGDDAYDRIASDVRRLFPPVEFLQLKNVSKTQKKMQVKLRGDVAVPAEQMSEGLLYFLAYAALPYLGPTSLLLVEEPENGLHPSRVADVVRALRSISESTETQVLLATHSPLVVNELRPDEVSVVTRTPDAGTQVRKLKDTPNFEERSKVYALGELWLSYANGIDEAPLFATTPP